MEREKILKYLQSTNGKNGLTQCQKIIRHMDMFGTITTFEAFNDYGIMRLASRITDLKNAGFAIRSEWCESFNRFGETVRFKKYWLAKESDFACTE